MPSSVFRSTIVIVDFGKNDVSDNQYSTTNQLETLKPQKLDLFVNIYITNMYWNIIS